VLCLPEVLLPISCWLGSGSQVVRVSSPPISLPLEPFSWQQQHGTRKKRKPTPPPSPSPGDRSFLVIPIVSGDHGRQAEPRKDSDLLSRQSIFIAEGPFFFIPSQRPSFAVISLSCRSNPALVSFYFFPAPLTHLLFETLRFTQRRAQVEERVL
jgi:hypothetical protein